jgi:hypothetical protein
VIHQTKRRTLVLMVAALVCLPMLAACDVGGGGGTATKSNADLIKEAAANMKAATSYHMDADVAQGETTVKMGGDIDIANDKAKLNMTVGTTAVEVVRIGDDLYTSLDGGQTWTKGGAGDDIGIDQLTGIWDQFKPEEVDKSKDALKDGSPATEQIDGVDTKHITANAQDLQSLSASGTTSTVEGTMDMWVTTDAKPTMRQLKIDGTSDGQPIQGTFKWNKINEQFDIQAPPTQ